MGVFPSSHTSKYNRVHNNLEASIYNRTAGTTVLAGQIQELDTWSVLREAWYYGSLRALMIRSTAKGRDAHVRNIVYRTHFM